MNEKTCPECGKPVDSGVEHPGATIYHMSCLMKAFEPIRAKQKELRCGQPDEVGQEPAG